MLAKTFTREVAVLSRTLRFAVAPLTGAALVAVTQVSAQAAAAPHPSAAVTVRAAAADPVVPLKGAAMIHRTKKGYRYTAGQQDSHLVLTRVPGGLRFRDAGTNELRSYPGGCQKQRVRDGIAAVCKVPARVTARRPLTVKIVPRLGDDFVDSSRLSASFGLHVLADAGRDVIRAGAGDDFINGAQDADRVWGGAGNDWIRTGLGNDALWGGPGRDRLVGVDGLDTIHGGKGNDRVGGGPGNDGLYGNAGGDHLLCGTGRDDALADQADTVARDCESVKRG
jgi:hypothetical protein